MLSKSEESKIQEQTPLAPPPSLWDPCLKWKALGRWVLMHTSLHQPSLHQRFTIYSGKKQVVKHWSRALKRIQKAVPSYNYTPPEGHAAAP